MAITPMPYRPMTPLSRRSLMTLTAFGLTGLVSGRAALAQFAKPAMVKDDYAVEKLDGVKFSRSAEITNKWLPMRPRTRYTYEGTTVEDDGKVVPHKIVLHFTDLVKVIGGIPNLVSYDHDYKDKELVEIELAFYAQDDDGNVWRFGEYPEEYEDGKFVKAPAWIHGYEGAHAGIMMKASPKLDTPSYSQGYGPAVDWTDRATTYQMGLDVKVPYGEYKDVMVVRETARSEVDAYQLKYYAAGIGNIKVGWMGSGEKSKENLELVSVDQLNPKEMADVRVKALALEKSAYKRSKKVYAPTSPSKVMTAART